MKLYISGPITNTDPNTQAANLGRFNMAAALLEASGYEVCNPADLPAGLSYAAYMRTDLADMLKCDGVAVLAGWRLSRGAKLEVQVAETCGLTVHTLNLWIRTGKS